MDRLITVSATATRAIPIERAEWRLRIREVDPSPGEAFARCAERLNALAEALRTAGELTTGEVDVDIDHERRGERHVARASLTVAGPVERAGGLAEAAMSAGADEISGPRLLAVESAAVGDELLAEAIRAARRRAEVMAAAAGRRLGAAVAISDGSAIRGDDLEVELMARRVSGGPVVEPRAHTVRATVQASFELLDAPADGAAGAS